MHVEIKLVKQQKNEDAYFQQTGSEIKKWATVNSLHAPVRKRRFQATPVCLHDN